MHESKQKTTINRQVAPSDKEEAPSASQQPTLPAVITSAGAVNRQALTPANILRLQQTVGNKVVTRMLQNASPSKPSSGKVIQRKNLEQANLNTGLETEKTKRTLVSDGREVKIFAQGKLPHVTGADKKEARTKALQKAGELNGLLGKRVDDHAEATWGIRNSNDKWTKKNENLDDNSLNKVDPFFYEAIVQMDIGDETQSLGLFYQHAAQWTGYVEAIFDPTNDAAHDFPTMFDKNEDTTVAKSDKNLRNPKYSNVHDQDLSGTSPKLIDLTEGDEEKNFDAYTKIGGEGARWQCVRNHASAIQDTSYFFVKVNPLLPNSDVYAVTFKDLWLSWKDTFGKKYNIDDAIVAGHLRGDTLIRSFGTKTKSLRAKKNISEMSTKDYDLDAHAGHRVI